MSKVLVTGGCGFIGRNLIERLIESGHSVTSYDNYMSGRETSKTPGVKYIDGDTREISSVLANEGRFDVCFHLAEYSRVASSFRDIERVWDSNSTGTFKVLQYCRQNDTKVIYGGSSTRFALEGTDHSPYTFTKNKSVELIQNLGNWFGMRYAIVYFYCVFGKGNDTSPVPGFQSVIDIFRKQYESGQPLTVTGDGSNKRAFTYIGDVIEGLIAAWEYEENESFQLSPDREYTILEIAKMYSDDITFIPQRPGDRSLGLGKLDSKSRDLLGWSPTVDISDWIEEIKKSGNPTEE